MTHAKTFHAHRNLTSVSEEGDKPYDSFVVAESRKDSEQREKRHRTPGPTDRHSKMPSTEKLRRKFLQIVSKFSLYYC